MKSIGIKSDHISEFDWWDSATLKTPLTGDAQLKITCTPCQHFSGRGIFDRNATLWASWAVEFENPKQAIKAPPCKVWFGGDTGYRSVPRGYPRDQEHTLPHCPVFKDIGEKFGGFDLAVSPDCSPSSQNALTCVSMKMIPIGAFEPRWFMSSVHCNPEDSVAMHLDVKSRKSVGIHWACFPLTCEKVWEPKERLEATVARTEGMQKDDFIALNRIGETLRVNPKSGAV
jgi:N-acyl-phosphatidylethanolamine-hydrolysing phospholipase D